MITLRPSSARGQTHLSWLESFHTFSFGEYLDPAHMSFRALRVINDDVVAPGGGFGMHPHRDMEIISWVLSGAMEHRDSLGHGAVIHPGEAQVMSAGTGLRHSEFNPSPNEPLRLLQMWLTPAHPGATPRYDQKLFPLAERTNRLRVIASPDGRDGSLTIGQDAIVSTGILNGAALRHEIASGRSAWVHVARGGVALNGTALSGGDAAAVTEERSLEFTQAKEAEIMLFDLA
jgi:quercetin 2,3-dioxygenase